MPTLHEALGTIQRHSEDLRFRQRSHDAVRAVFSSIPPSARAEVRDMSVSERGVSLTVVSLETAAAVAVDDVIEAGLKVDSAARPGEGVSVTPYFRRLRCANGLVYVECGAPGRFMLSASDAHLDELEEATSRLWSDLPARLGELRALPRTRAEVPALLLDIVRRADLGPRRLMPRLLSAWQEEGSTSTEWGAVNSLTRVTTHATDIEPLERAALSRMAGTLAFRHTHVCSRCARPLTWRDTRLVRSAAWFVRGCLEPAVVRAGQPQNLR